MRLKWLVVVALAVVAAIALTVNQAGNAKVDEPQIERITSSGIGEYYPEAEAQDEVTDSYEGIYCVREPGFPVEGTPESDYPGCTWVDRLEDLPTELVTFLPSHCGLDDFAEIRERCWSE